MYPAPAAAPGASSSGPPRGGRVAAAPASSRRPSPTARERLKNARQGAPYTVSVRACVNSCGFLTFGKFWKTLKVLFSAVSFQRS